jgi:hypothetical protein
VRLRPAVLDAARPGGVLKLGADVAGSMASRSAAGRAVVLDAGGTDESLQREAPARGARRKKAGGVVPPVAESRTHCP